MRPSLLLKRSWEQVGLAADLRQATPCTATTWLAPRGSTLPCAVASVCLLGEHCLLVHGTVQPHGCNPAGGPVSQHGHWGSQVHQLVTGDC